MAACDLISGHVIALQGDHLWTFDLATRTWTVIAQRPSSAVASLLAYDASVDRLVLYEMGVDTQVNGPFGVQLFDIRTGTWTTSRAAALKMNFSDQSWCDFCPSGNEIAYDEATQQIIIFSYGRVIAYDASVDEWQVLIASVDPDVDPRALHGPTNRFLHAMVYDSVNDRLIVYGGHRFADDGSIVDPDDVLTFDPVVREWTTLLEASPAGLTP